jgi:hypothetical protein
VSCRCFLKLHSIWRCSGAAVLPGRFVLDAVDGYYARLLQQTSTLGTVLDMVTDRCAGWQSPRSVGQSRLSIRRALVNSVGTSCLQQEPHTLVMSL